MEHNYEVKTSNRVLTVARSSGRITEDFLWLAGWVFYDTYLVTERGREWTRVDQEGARLRDVLNITLQSSPVFLGCSDKVLHWLHYSLN